MPRKTKEQKELENEKTDKTKQVSKSTVSKKVASSKVKKADSKKKTATTSKAKTTSSKKKTSTTKKSTKSTTSKSKTKSTTKAPKKKVELVEYYDLPYRYNQTIVKVLYQTPTTLFVYWDISDKDRKNLQNQYGEKVFEITKPVLVVYNNTYGYQFEVEINDFANSWYLHVADAKCDYKIELGRRPIYYENNAQVKDMPSISTDYIYITTSNEIESPNNHILFDKNQEMVYFKNVKTGEKQEKATTSISFIRNMGKIYHIYDLYKELYKAENIEDINHSSKFK